MSAWTIRLSDEKSFNRFVKKLSPYEEAVLFAAIDYILKPLGDDICSGEWGKPLGQGLYEFRVRQSLAAIYSGAGLTEEELPANAKLPHSSVLLRVFCTFEGSEVVLLLGGYNKGKDPSKRRQQVEIKKARTRLTKHKEAQKRQAAR